jgi:hypothetical protein
MLPAMAIPALPPMPTTRESRWRTWVKKAATLILLGVVFGVGYDWAVPRLYGPADIAGFGRGVVHGALMPVALPSLVAGRDVPIYAPRNTGRAYKLGYIAGINLCGLVFFGLAFRRPRPPASAASPPPEPAEPRPQ